MSSVKRLKCLKEITGNKMEKNLLLLIVESPSTSKNPPSFKSSDVVSMSGEVTLRGLFGILSTLRN